MLVVDTSVALSALASRPSNQALLERLGQDGDLHAPHLIDVEMLHALRRLVARDRFTAERADVRTDFVELRIMRYPHQPLADRMWVLRHNVTAHDAAFLVLGEVLGVPPVTCDARLAAAAEH